MAAIKSIKVAPGTNNIPTAFDGTAGSRVITGLGQDVYTHLMVLNETTARLCIYTNGDAKVAPSSTSNQKLYVLGSSAAAFDGVSIGDAIYVQSDSGSAVSAGTLTIIVW